MQMPKYEELENRASSVAERDAILRLEARARVHAEIGKMIEEEKALVLSEEEERMLRSFRRFKRGCKPGALFKWQTRPPVDQSVEIVSDSGLVRDPQEVE